MTVLHTGATKKFVAGWENIFSAKGKKPAATPNKPAAKKKAPAGKKPAKKSKGGKR